MPISVGEIIKPETGIQIYINNVEYTNNSINYEFKERDNEMSTFSIELLGVTQEDTNVKQDMIVRFESQGVLLYKGIIERPDYQTGETTVIKGYGAGESYAKRILADITASADSTSSPLRPVYTQKNISTIISEQVVLVPELEIDLVDDGSDLGNGTYRVDHTSVLSIIANTTIAKQGHWWFTYGNLTPFNNNIFHSSAYRGSGSAIDTFSISGDNQNASSTKNEQDFENLVNYTEILGFGDGLNQLRSVNFHATTNRSYLSVDITSIATTISLEDSSSFPISGNVWIGMEKISYSGKSGNNLTGCTRGVTGGYIAYAHNKGIEVYDAQYTSTIPQTGSKIDTYGLKQKSFQDKSIINQNALDQLAQNIREEFDDLVTRIELIPSDTYKAIRTIKIDDTIKIIDSDSGLNEDFKVNTRTLKSDNGYEQVTFECANRRLSFSEDIKDTKNIADIESRFMQGSTTLITANTTENAESGTTAPGPVDLFFEIPAEAIAINQIKFSYRNEVPRIWNKSASPSSTQTGVNDGTGVFSTTGLASTGSSDWKVVFSGALGNAGNLFFAVGATIRAYVTSSSAGTLYFRLYDVQAGTYYPNSTGLTVAHGAAASDFFPTASVPIIWAGYNSQAGTAGFIGGHTLSLEVAASSSCTVAVDYKQHFWSMVAYDNDYDIVEKVYTTNDVSIYTTNDANTGSPTWTDRTAAIETVLGRALAASAIIASGAVLETGLNLTSYFTDATAGLTTGWKGIRLATNGNSRHKLQVTAKVFIEAKNV